MVIKLKRGKYAVEHPVRQAAVRAPGEVPVPLAKNAERWLTKIKMYVPSWLVGGTFHSKR
jgi:hypothetical protein